LEMNEIFLSYRESDSEGWAVKIAEDIAEAFGDDSVFLDKDSLRAGKWNEQIQRALTMARVVVVIIGPQWVATLNDRRRRKMQDVHREEVAFALAQQNTIVIPACVGNADMPDRDVLPTEIQKLCDQQARTIGASADQRNAGLGELLMDIERVLGRPAKANRRPDPISGEEEIGGRSSGGSLFSLLNGVMLGIAVALAMVLSYFWYRWTDSFPENMFIVLFTISVVFVWVGRWLATTIHRWGRK
jgi:TIR domain